ncbi:N-acetyltransferase [Sphingomonas sp. DBB INV C78]|uniref:GNAT family N-acetyltransferase n=1 Tax=Sphingomonas sp. DBB INV C78 TaxID=3349434 RepID=UPI0036D42F01
MSVRLSFDAQEQQLDVIHDYLAQSYWSPGIPRATVERAIANSIVVGAFEDGAQLGFARVVSDRATFAYLADVFVLEPHRGRGIARAMIEALHAHPELQGLRRWALFTRDMQPLYARLGWTPYPHPPERLMVREDDEVYSR